MGKICTWVDYFHLLKHGVMGIVSIKSSEGDLFRYRYFTEQFRDWRYDFWDQ